MSRSSKKAAVPEDTGDDTLKQVMSLLAALNDRHAAMSERLDGISSLDRLEELSTDQKALRDEINGTAGRLENRQRLDDSETKQHGHEHFQWQRDP